MWTQEQYNVLIQKNRELNIKIEILNSYDNVIDKIEGVTIDGSIDISSDSPIRRTCNLKMVLKNKLLPSPSSSIWLNKRFRVLIGIRSLKTDEIVFFDYGIFVISDPSIDIQISNKTLSIKGYDKICLMNNDVSGSLMSKVIIESGTPIHEAIRATVTTLGGENKVLIDTSPYITPYKIEKDTGSTVWDIVDELTNLYMNFQSFYDTSGRFVFTQKRNKLNDPIIWDFSQTDFRLNSSVQINFNNIKNNYTIYGKLKDDGTQLKAEKTLTNTNSPNSDFTVEKIGQRNFFLQNDKLFTQEQCDQQLNWEIKQHTNFCEKVNISCIPIYMLSVNDLVYFNNPEDNLVGKYCITNISVSLKPDSSMGLQGYRVYEI